MLQSREARKSEQQNNPHYLKGTTVSERSSNDNDNIENIPVAELNLNVPPLKVVGQKRSDKYLNIHKEKKPKKKSKKKNKHHKSERWVSVCN